jgi:hypothetical protein
MQRCQILEEREFLLDLCYGVLSVDKSIRFVGVIDVNGKLLAGKYRSNLQRPLITTSHTSDFSQNSFYSGYLALTIKKKFESDLGDLHFQLTEFEKVKLLTIPLTSRNDRYLCVSLDNIASYEKTISKIIDSI